MCKIKSVFIYKFCVFFVFFEFLAIFLQGQEYNLPLSQSFSNRAGLILIKDDTCVLRAFNPMRVNYVSSFGDSNVLDFGGTRKIYKNQIANYFINQFFSDDLIKIRKNNLELNFNFLFNVSNTKLQGDSGHYSQNTRGFEINGSLGDNLSFYSDFYENQVFLLPYINQKANETLIVNGQGVWKPFGIDKTGKDYNFATGYLSYSPCKSLNFQLGQSKFFIGNGYRSLLLSDNSAAYPFFKIDFTKGKWQYIAMFTEFENFATKFYFRHHKKNGSFIFVDYSPIKWFEIGLFESIIWHTSDDSTFLKRFGFDYFVPLIGFRELMYGFNNNNNAMLGLNTRFTILKIADIYGQFLLDNYTTKSFEQRWAAQAGIKVYDLFFDKLKLAKLFFQIEYNKATPYTYTHNTPVSAYTHMNEPLASPLGAGFEELVGITKLSIYRFEIGMKYNHIFASIDTVNSNFGVNLLKSNVNADFQENENFVGQGNASQLSYLTINVAFLINPKTNFYFFVEYNKRSQTVGNNLNANTFVTFGIKNELKNFYTDF